MNRTLILTDVSEVLVSGLYGIGDRITERRLPSLVRKYGEEEGTKRARAAGEHIWKLIQDTEAEFQELLRGKLTEEQYWDITLNYNDILIEEVKEAFSDNLKRIVPGTLNVYQRIVRYPVSPKPGCTEFIDGMPEIVILSDHIENRVLELNLVHPDIFKVVSGAYWSYSLGKIKRDPGCFELVLQCLGRDPSSVIAIDDSRRNILAAEAAGMNGIIFKDAARLESVLRDAYHFEFAPKIP